MRAGLSTTLAWMGLAVALSGCGGNGATTGSAGCTGAGEPPAVALLAWPADQPTRQQAICRLAINYRDVILERGWDDAAKRLRKVNPQVSLWQRRTLALACTGCESSGLDLAQVRDDHPQWILRDAAGNEVHLANRPDEVLLDFGDPDYQATWQERVGVDLAAGGWSGVVIDDARNDLQLSATPIDPRTGQPMTDADRARYLAEALALVRGALKTDGFSLVADNEPPSIVDKAQIGSTDAVMAQDQGGGFAGRRGAAWDELFTYYQAAVDRHVGAWVSDGGAPRSRSLFGVASYFLVSGPLSSYGPVDGPRNALYDIDLGEPADPAREVNGAWVRTFAAGTVAVAPGETPVQVEFPGHGTVDVPAGGAVIETADRLVK
jgi:hypothetical protein